MDSNEILRLADKLPGTAGRPDYALALHKIVSILPDNATVIEIGTQSGGSAAVFAMTLKNRGGKIYCIDPCFIKEEDRPSSYAKFMIGAYTLPYVENALNDLAVRHTVTLLPGTSEEVLSNWSGEKIDMLFIDGDHTYEAVKTDMQWLKHAKDKCILMLDDWITPVEKACKEELENFKGFDMRADNNFWPIYFLRGY